MLAMYDTLNIVLKKLYQLKMLSWYFTNYKSILCQTTRLDRYLLTTLILRILKVKSLIIESICKIYNNNYGKVHFPSICHKVKASSEVERNMRLGYMPMSVIINSALHIVTYSQDMYVNAYQRISSFSVYFTVVDSWYVCIHRTVNFDRKKILYVILV